MGYPKLAVQGKSQMDDKWGTPMTQEIPISVKLSLRSPQPYPPSAPWAPAASPAAWRRNRCRSPRRGARIPGHRQGHSHLGVSINGIIIVESMGIS